MREYRSIRDLLSESPPVDPGRTPEEDRARVALPGDPVDGLGNPYAGRNPQGLLKLLRSGSLGADDERQVRQAIALFEGFSGDRLNSGMSRPVRPGAPRTEMLPDVAGNPDRDPELEDLFRDSG